MANNTDLVYRISIENPQHHYYHVEMRCRGGENGFRMRLPAWTPGSYMIRDFASHLHMEGAWDENGQPVDWLQTMHDQWQFNTAGIFTARYRVYASEKSVRTSFLDSAMGLVSPAGVFLYPEGELNRSVAVQFELNGHFKHVYTSLDKNEDGYIAADFDELYDSPFALSNQQSFVYDSGGCSHEVLIEGNVAPAKKNQIITDLKKITDFEIEYFGGTPNTYYLFIIDMTEPLYGGLEHLSSSVNMFDPDKIYDRDEYLKLLSLLAHEYFHHWNGKRLRPLELGPFDYQKPNITRDLWLVEGITSHYDNYMLLLAGYFSPDQYLSRVMADLQVLENSAGEEWMSLDESSVSAWTKFYKPHADSHNTGVSYYVKGAVLVICMDIFILAETKCQKRFMDIVRELYFRYFMNEGRGITRDEFFNTAREVTGVDLRAEFEKYLTKRIRIPVYDYLSRIGVERLQTDEVADFGFQIQMKNGSVNVSRIFKHRPAALADVNIGDELIAVNGQRIKDSNAEFVKSRLNPGDEAALLLSRKGRIIERKVVLGRNWKNSVLFIKNGLDPQTQMFSDFYLNKTVSGA